MTKSVAKASGGDERDASGGVASSALELRVERYDGDRSALRSLLLLADDSEREIAGYINDGVIFVAREVRRADEPGEPDKIVGHLLLTGDGEILELKSMAVAEHLQGRGVGRLLVEAAIAHCHARGVRQLLVATAAAGIGQLRFYQRLGFRMLRIERDAFGPHTGYAEGILIEGIPLRDRVWFSMEL
jgi:GNAT superfamily N-acetyltransferase